MANQYDLHYEPSLPADIAALLEALDDSTREWRGELGEVPEEAIGWQPFPDGPSIGAELMHIAGVEQWWLQDACRGIPCTPEQKKETMREEINVDQVHWPVPPKKPLSWYLELLDRIRAETKEHVREMGATDEMIARTEWNGFGATRRWILAHVVEHDSYHGGQAVLLKTLWERRDQLGQHRL